MRFLLLMVFGLTSFHAAADTPAEEGSKIRYFSEVVTFEKGSSVMSEEQLNDLRIVADYAKSSGKVLQVKIAAWPDVPYAEGKSILFKQPDIVLANARAYEIREALLQQIRPVFIKIINMAKEADWLDRMLDSEENQLKEALISHDNDQIGKLSEDMQMIYRKGDASTAVAILKIDTGAREEEEETDTSSPIEVFPFDYYGIKL